MSSALMAGTVTEDEIGRLLDQVLGDEKPDINIENQNELFNKKIRIQYPNRPVDINGVTCHPFIAKIHNMIVKGQSPEIAIVGDKGLGKSRAALILADKLHKIGVMRGEFNPHEQVIYRVIPFLMFYRSSTRRVAMYDEANETLNKNDYNSPMNTAVAGALRTQRIRQIVDIFVGPELQEFDPRIRNNIHIVIELKDKQFASITKYENKHGKRGNRGLDFNFQNYPNWDIPECPAELDAAYDEIDKGFKKEYLDELLERVLTKKLEEYQEKRIKT